MYFQNYLTRLKDKMSAGILVMVILVGISHVAATLCPHVPPDPTGKTRFTEELGSLDYIALQKSIPLLCCATNFDNITWYRQNGNTWEPYPPSSHWGSNAPTLDENNQVLRIYSASMADNTTFRCNLLKDSRVVKSHMMRLSVIACDSLTRGPMFVEPFPQDQRVASLGGNVTFYCTGYYGCDTEAARIVHWNLDDLKFNSIIKTNDRYNVTSIERTTTLTTTLTISPTTEEDLHHTFICVITSPQIIKGTSNMRVRLIKQDELNITLIVVIAAAVFVFVIIIILLTCLVRKFYGPRIKLYISSRLFFCAPKTISEDEFTHNIFIYHADDEQLKAETIRKKLKEKNYDVFMTSDVDGNRSMQLVYEQEIHQSAIVMFLYSKSLLEDPYADFLFTGLINDRNGKGILFLEIDNFEPEEIMNRKKDAKNKNLAVKDQGGNNDAEGPNNDSDDNAERTALQQKEEEIDGNKDHPDKNSDKVLNLKFWKSLPRYKVPSLDASGRKQKNFWCHLQNAIPKFEHQVQATKNNSKKPFMTNIPKGRNSSSTKPLIGNVDVPPNCALNGAAEFSPNTDEVFAFDNAADDRNNLRENTYAAMNMSQDIDVNVGSQGQRFDIELNASSEESLQENNIVEIVNADVHIQNMNDNTVAKERAENQHQNEKHGKNRESRSRLPSPQERQVFVLSDEHTDDRKRHANPELENQRLPEAMNPHITGYNKIQLSASCNGELSPINSLSNREEKSDSSGFIDFSNETNFQSYNLNQNSLGPSLSPDSSSSVCSNDTAMHNGGTRTGKLHVNIGPKISNFSMNSHSSPESGYITSLSERTCSSESNGPFIKQMNKDMENTALKTVD